MATKKKSVPVPGPIPEPEECLPPDPWVGRAAAMRCITCMWFVEKGPIGRCRKHSPTMDGYPVVFPDDWCGDHKLDENRI